MRIKLPPCETIVASVSRKRCGGVWAWPLEHRQLPSPPRNARTLRSTRTRLCCNHDQPTPVTVQKFCELAFFVFPSSSTHRPPPQTLEPRRPFADNAPLSVMSAASWRHGTVGALKRGHPLLARLTKRPTHLSREFWRCNGRWLRLRATLWKWFSREQELGFATVPNTGMQLRNAPDCPCALHNRKKSLQLAMATAISPAPTCGKSEAPCGFQGWTGLLQNTSDEP